MTKPYQERSYIIHPSSIMIALILIGITALFGALSFAYLYTRVDKGMLSIKIPWLFVLNTFILAASSVFIQMSRSYFEKKNEKVFLQFGFLTLVATIFFLLLQGVAWYQLLSAELRPGSTGGHGYLYAISILHFLHVIAGIPFLLRIIIPVHTAIREGNASLIFISDEMRRKLKHTAWYWHFIDLMWIYLMVFFVANSYV